MLYFPLWSFIFQNGNEFSRRLNFSFIFLKEMVLAHYCVSPSNIDKVNEVNGCGAHASFICLGVCLSVCPYIRDFLVSNNLCRGQMIMD